MYLKLGQLVFGRCRAVMEEEGSRALFFLRARFSDWLNVACTICGAAMVLLSVGGQETHAEHWFNFNTQKQ